jgi:exo-beta-1,3-glucanase (GH17 family)
MARLITILHRGEICSPEGKSGSCWRLARHLTNLAFKGLLMNGAAARRFSLVAILTALFSCPTAGKGEENTPTNAPAFPIKQKAGDLICGITRAVCYSPFRHGQRPGGPNPSEQEILEDLRILCREGQFHLLRTYDADDTTETALRLIEAHHLKISVMLGAWLRAEVVNTNCPWLKTPTPPEELAQNRAMNAQEIERAIRLANRYPKIVVAVAVGNEALVDWNDHLVPVETVIGYVRHVRHSVNQPVTVCDNYAWWAQNGLALAREVDFVSIHTYAEWDGKDIDEAMPYTIANVQRVRDALPHSRIVITEAGWATAGSQFGSRASQEKQKRYYDSLFAWAGKMNITTFWFEAFDEDWKGNPKNALDAEKFWGLYTVDRQPKLAVSPDSD